MSLSIPRLSKPDAFNLQLTDKTVPMEHYSGPGYVIPPCPQVMEFEGQTVEEALKLEEATRKDASYLCQLKTAAALEWSGFNSKYKRACDQHTIPKPKTFYVYGPLIDAPASHPDTVQTTMAYLQKTLKSLFSLQGGSNHSPLALGASIIPRDHRAVAVS